MIGQPTVPVADTAEARVVLVCRWSRPRDECAADRFAVEHLDQLYSRNLRNCYAIGFNSTKITHYPRLDPVESKDPRRNNEIDEFRKHP